MADDKNSASEENQEGANLPEDQGNEGDGNTENSNEEGQSSSNDDNEEGDEGDEGDDDGDDINDDEEPTTRKSANNAFHAGQRIARKQAKQGKSDEGGDDDEGNGDDKGGDQKPDPTDIQDAVAQAIKPFTDKMAEQETRDEVSTFITENPHFKPYQKKILNFAKHPTRAHLPIETVALEAVGRKGLLKMGAQMSQEADKEGSQTQSGGTSTRNQPSGKNVNDMSKDEFEAKQEEIRNKQ